MVKKVGGAFLKIVHEKYRAKATEEQGIEQSLFVDQMETITDAHPELKPHTIRSTELLTPIRAFNILTKVQEEDAMLLWMNR